ncbi:uncharacterized protein B0I36DRAFT_359475 [Microdochium trichocladiopsis]|uniref:Uncharacterized protein n=1 Tax=Microdochium trichocladiopsis TaxID=1682393 RepID=A0A9P8YE84_9PEZI|nr:uncharacterized protein B0I36DRAFT_359475 [Microdochium trichocladiopsis]KAH7037835.1 hypothetical protein B0I36DRAFT_359475 [Microdochium trichocladiopsis]
MPGEEMDIMTDFGPAGLTEDIDIDLDLAAATHPDEDLELDDFDHSADLQLFNSDGRDELMAEGDDASYGMVDADDVEHAETMATTDDIDIDLVAVESDPLWHGDGAGTTSTLQMVQEIDFVDADKASEGIQDVVPQPISTNTGDNLAAEATINGWQDHEGTATTSQLPNVENEEAEDYQHDPEATGDRAPGTSDLNSSEASGDGSLATVVPQKNPVTFGEKGSTPITSTENAGEQTGSAESPDVIVGSSLDYTDKPETQRSGEDGEEAHHTSSHDDDDYDTELAVPGDSSNPTEQISDVPDLAADEAEININDTAQAAVDHVEGLQHATDSMTDFASLKAPEKPDDIDNFGGDDEAATPNNTNSTDAGVRSHEQEQREPLSDRDYEGQEEHAPELPTDFAVAELHTELGQSLDMMISRHRPVISYKRTDYSLLAESESDDPDSYFLKDSAALDTPLDQFLAALRQVISAEISPLDELVLYVDGLGLEFAESSALSLLSEHTYMELLQLYDQLTHNDGAETVPPFYAYLSVRPSGAQRLLALQESAKAGHGLSQVAVYREFTPDEDLEELRSQSDFDLPSDHREQDDEDAESEHHDSPVEHTHTEESFVAREMEHAAHTGESPRNDAGEEPDAPAEDNPSTDVQQVQDEFDDELDLSPTHQDDIVVALLDDNHSTTAKGEVQVESDHIDDLANEASSRDVDGTPSANTSATVTADGGEHGEHDEIGYTDDEDEDASQDQPNGTNSAEAEVSLSLLEVPPPPPPPDDEITWESDHEEEAVDEGKSGPVQVSPVAGKRTRSDSIDVADTNEQNDVKRQRS